MITSSNLNSKEVDMHQSWEQDYSNRTGEISLCSKSFQTKTKTYIIL